MIGQLPVVLTPDVAPFGHRARVSRVEEEIGGTSRTVDTLRALQARHPDVSFAWVAGSDLKAELPSWKEPKALERLARWIWLPRRGVARAADDPPYVFPDISSTEIRLRAARGDSLQGWVPREVAALIQRVRPYRAVEDP